MVSSQRVHQRNNMVRHKVLMLAAENGRFAGAKVGGVGDVIRDLPPVLSEAGCDVMVAMPSYGFLARLPQLEAVATLKVMFGGIVKSVELLRLVDSAHPEQVYIFHHPDFAPQGERVYCDDSNDRPFATDANKFALFCASVATALLTDVLAMPSVIHCHDWHTGFLPMLTRRCADYARLAPIKIVYTIHNLAMQGVRPLTSDPSSLHAWFPNLSGELSDIYDPDYRNCVNPMRAAIRLADVVHTVSPTYASEILQPSDTEQGVFGGERLQADLQEKADSNALFGILNGCNYPAKSPRKPAKKTVVATALAAVEKWMGASVQLSSTHYLADRRLLTWAKKAKGITVTSVGRITEQKVRLLFSPAPNGKIALANMLDSLGEDGVFIMLGSGAAHYEAALTKLAGQYANFIFLNGYEETLSELLYHYGDLFLMPSSFEPCGISQLLAMRAGQPCLVGSVGGLKDTVTHHANGFVFDGANDAERVVNMQRCFDDALALYHKQPEAYKKISVQAKSTRFTWAESAQEYIAKLYG